jgi:hypothetical protein
MVFVSGEVWRWWFYRQQAMPETPSRNGITQAQLSRVGSSRVESIDGGSLIGMCGKRRVSKPGLRIISDARAEVKKKKAKVAINAEHFTGMKAK